MSCCKFCGMIEGDFEGNTCRMCMPKKPAPPPTRSVRGDIKPPPPEPPPMRVGQNGHTMDRHGVRRNAHGVVIGAPPTVEYRKAPGSRYDWSMMLVAVGMASAGFIVGFLARGGV